MIHEMAIKRENETKRLYTGAHTHHHATEKENNTGKNQEGTQNETGARGEARQLGWNVPAERDSGET